MPSSNDRKISQLPLLAEIKEDTTFLVVSDVGTTPKNERMFAKTFFQQIPSSVSVGQELDGRDVTFNSTLNPTNRFHFDSLTGDVSIGHNLNVANTLSVENDLYCSGNVYFDSFTPNFANLEIDGDFLCGGQIGVGNTLTVLGETNLQQHVHIWNDVHIDQDLYVTELSSLDKIKNNFFEGLHANIVQANITTLQATHLESSTASFNKLHVETSYTSNGSIQIQGNLWAQIGTFSGVNISQDATVNRVLYTKDIVSSTFVDTPFVHTQNVKSIHVETYTLDATNQLTSPVGNFTDLLSQNVTSSAVSTDVITTEHIKSNTTDFGYFSTKEFDANNITANTVTTDLSVADLMQTKIYTTRPDGNLLPEGTMIFFHDTGADNLTLEVLYRNTGGTKQWKTVYLGNVVPI